MTIVFNRSSGLSLLSQKRQKLTDPLRCDVDGALVHSFTGFPVRSLSCSLARPLTCLNEAPLFRLVHMS